MTYIILSKSEEKKFTSRDELFHYLEEENARVLSLKIESNLSIRQVDENGEITDSLSLSLPFTPPVDSLLENFGLSKESKSKGRLAGFSKTSKKGIAPEKDKEEPRKAISAQKERASPLMKFLQLGSVLILIGTLFFSLLWMRIDILKSERYLERRLNEVVSFQKETPKMDTFARYFLPRYYSGDSEKMKDYFSRDVQDIAVQNAQLQSVLFEGIDGKGDQAQLTYVLFIKTESETKTIRLILDIERDDKAAFGYLIVSEPREELYP